MGPRVFAFVSTLSSTFGFLTPVIPLSSRDAWPWPGSVSIYAQLLRFGQRVACAVRPRAVAIGTAIVTLAFATVAGDALVLFAQTPPAAAAHQAPTAVPQRIVSIIPATTEMLFAMGAESRLVGIGNYDHFPPAVERIPRVGGLIDPNTERLLALKPDLVVVYDTQVELKQQLQRAGVPIFNYSHRGLADITETMRALGRRVGASAAADAAASDIERQLAAIHARVAGRPTPRTLLVFGREPGTLRQVNASAGLGFLHDMLLLAGGADVLGELGKQSAMLSTEMLMTRAPEVIIELHYGSSLGPGQLERERTVWNALPSIPAVRNHKVFLLMGDEFVVPGPRIVLAAQRLARTLHPDAFP